MIKNCTLYFPVSKLALKSVFPDGRSDGGLFRTARWFEYESGDGMVSLSLVHQDLEQHLRGFRGYVAQLSDSGAARAEAQRLIQQSKMAVGVVLPHPVGSDSKAFASLMRLLKKFDGFMFVADSILLRDGSFLVGPMAGQSKVVDPPQAAPIRAVDPAALRHMVATDDGDAQRVAQREHHYRLLAEQGFRCARSLPLYRSDDPVDKLRSVEEIGARLLALGALFYWVVATEDIAASARILAFLERDNLRSHLNGGENAILSLSRVDANAAHAGTIGWRLENMWALAWILGFEPPPPFHQGQLPREVSTRMLNEFLPDFDATLAGFVAACTLRSAAEVGQLEDLYYCAHNAVRSAQQGEDTLPTDWHPMRDGGAIHERRHALTWSLSPGVAWEECDLST